MIVQFKKENLTARESLDRRVLTKRPAFDFERSATKVEFRKVVYALPFLFIAGILTGVGIMLSLTT